eukprot:7821167-Prorocentrum_lima.AAC.1
MWTPSAPCYGYPLNGARAGRGPTLPPGTPLAGQAGENMCDERRTRVVQTRANTEIARFQLIQTWRNNGT